MAVIDLKGLTDEELSELRDGVEDELQTRASMGKIMRQIDDLNRNALRVQDVYEGEPWRAPSGVHDAYPFGYTVKHNGKTWTNVMRSNVDEPGVAGWRESPAPGEYIVWVDPLGPSDTYARGTEVTHNGKYWRSTNERNGWEPGVRGWTEITPEPAHSV